MARDSRAHVVGGGELCNEGMLRKRGPTIQLTTYAFWELDLLRMLYCEVEIFNLLVFVHILVISI